MEIDPVCGMEIEKSDTTPKSEYEGKIYHFCSEDCREEFETDQDFYID